jgi:hypothetical protein
VIAIISGIIETLSVMGLSRFNSWCENNWKYWVHYKPEDGEAYIRT